MFETHLASSNKGATFFLPKHVDGEVMTSSLFKNSSNFDG